MYANKLRRRRRARRLASPRLRAFWALSCLLALAMAEVVINLADPIVGVTAYGLVLSALLLSATWRRDAPIGGFLLCLALVPIMRILSFCLPLSRVDRIYWPVFVSVPLSAAALLAVRELRLYREQVGFTMESPRLQVAVGMTGLLLGWVQYEFVGPGISVQTYNLAKLPIPILVLLVCTGFVEEFVFRGVILYATRGVIGRLGGVYVATLYAVLYVGYRSWELVIFAFAVSVFYGWVVAKTRSIVGVSLCHGLISVMVLLVMPLL